MLRFHRNIHLVSDLKVNQQIWLLFALLNLCGYDDENYKTIHPLRRRVRKVLTESQFGFGKNKKIKNYLKRSPWQVLNSFLSSPGSRTESLRKLLEHDNQLQKLWRTLSPSCSRQSRQLEKVGAAVVQRVVSYLKYSSPCPLTIFAVPNPLDAYWRGYSISPNKKTHYLVIGPDLKGKVNRVNVAHEFLHTIINPLLEEDKQLQLLARKNWLGKPAIRQIEDLAENLVTALTLRIILPPSVARMYLKDARERDLHLVSFFYRKLMGIRRPMEYRQLLILLLTKESKKRQEFQAPAS